MFLRYFHVCVFGESTKFTVWGVIIELLHIRSYTFDCFFKILVNTTMRFSQDTSAIFDKHFQLVFSSAVKIGK